MKKTLIASLMLSTSFAALAAPQVRPTDATIRIPGSQHGIGFDDLGYAPALHRILVPAGATGNLVLIDPATRALTVIPGVEPPPAHATQRRDGTTSAMYAAGYLFATGHDPAAVMTIDPRTHAILARTPLKGDPDYVRYVARTHEVWVTEPDQHQIQVFKLTVSPKPVLTAETVIPVAGGPEALEVDNRRDRAYTNARPGETVTIRLTTRRVVAAWPNTCQRGHGIALDTVHDHVFVACREGKVVVLAPAENGKVIASAAVGAGVDIISYSLRLHHLYVPGARAATLAILDVAPSGALRPVAVYKTGVGAHCVTDDNAGHVFVCDPRAGSILEIDDLELPGQRAGRVQQPARQ